jgi:hypothetical protein
LIIKKLELIARIIGVLLCILGWSKNVELASKPALVNSLLYQCLTFWFFGASLIIFGLNKNFWGILIFSLGIISLLFQFFSGVSWGGLLVGIALISIGFFLGYKKDSNKELIKGSRLFRTIGLVFLFFVVIIFLIGIYWSFQ